MAGIDSIERRRFLKVIGLTSSAALFDQCSPTGSENVIPYFVSPDDVTPGVGAYYATICRQCPAGCGMVVKTINGRITKAEGNPKHPINQGRLCGRGQAAVQAVYNPDRFRQPLFRQQNGTMAPISWPDAETMLADKLGESKRRGPNRIVWIGELQTDSLDELTAIWLHALHSDRRLFYESFDYEPLRQAGAIAFGRPEVPRYLFDRANFIMSFGAEFVETWISNVEFTAGYSTTRQRRIRDAFGTFACISPRRSLTGLNADVWVPARPGSEALVALATAHAIVDQGLVHPSAGAHAGWLRPALARFAAGRTAALTDVSPDSIGALARQFTAAAPSLAIGGGVGGTGLRHAASLEIAALLLNVLAGNVGESLTYGAGYALDRLATRDDLDQLIQSTTRGDVDVLLVHKANPVLTLPTTALTSALSHVPFVVSFASGPDETTDYAHLILPDHHFLEAWGDYTPRAGVNGVMQPVAERLFDTRATGDVLIDVANQIDDECARACGHAAWRDYVRSRWLGDGAAARGGESDLRWSETLRTGGRFAADAAPAPVALRDISSTLNSIRPDEIEPIDGFALVVSPSMHFYDGRSANESWLQEVPDPITSTVWNGYVALHPDAAGRLGVGEGDGVRVISPYGRLEAATHITRDTRADTIAMPLGYGRSPSLHVGGRRGANPAALLPPRAADGAHACWRVDGVRLERATGRVLLPVLDATMTAAAESTRQALATMVRPDRVDRPEAQPHPPVDFYPAHSHPEHRWGMAIDLNACTGCHACVVACYGENNIAVVGEQFCAQGREMSWIRIERQSHAVPADRGLQRDAHVFMPMLCQQCDEAPCESVCPVYATYHNPEGLNAQVYVRCIGTRFCSNNCPYKVRRFNWARYGWPAPLGEQLNPDVTVRSAGVMEKCTFCVQRIQAGKFEAKREGRAVRDGDITPACAQTCPADAIVFGDLHDPNSRVSRLSGAARGYHALEELNTRPAITYLRRSVPGAPDGGD